MPPPKKARPGAVFAVAVAGILDFAAVIAVSKSIAYVRKGPVGVEKRWNGSYFCRGFSPAVQVCEGG